jgi:hypothetical protein
MGTTAAQKKLFFNLRRMKKNLEAFEDSDLHPDDVKKIATDLGVPEAEVVSMNRRMMMGGDASLNVPLREDGEGSWQDWLADERPLQDEAVADAEEAQVRHDLLVEAMQDLNDRERHILIDRRLVDEPKTLEELSQSITSAANACARSRCAPLKSCKRRCSGLPETGTCFLQVDRLLPGTRNGADPSGLAPLFDSDRRWLVAKPSVFPVQTGMNEHHERHLILPEAMGSIVLA